MSTSNVSPLIAATLVLALAPLHSSETAAAPADSGADGAQWFACEVTQDTAYDVFGQPVREGGALDRPFELLQVANGVVVAYPRSLDPAPDLCTLPGASCYTDAAAHGFRYQRADGRLVVGLLLHASWTLEVFEFAEHDGERVRTARLTATCAPISDPRPHARPPGLPRA